jgi:hypothetical protein
MKHVVAILFDKMLLKRVKKSKPMGAGRKRTAGMPLPE